MSGSSMVNSYPTAPSPTETLGGVADIEGDAQHRARPGRARFRPDHPLAPRGGAGLRRRLLRRGPQAVAAYLNSMMPSALPPGSTIHAAQAKPRSATPSSVFRPGMS